jgi:hypothetical protein
MNRHSRPCGLVRRVRARAGDDAGQVTAFVTILAVALLAVAGLVLDAGTALSAKTDALNQAQAAARVGAQQLDLTAWRTRNQIELDPTRATTAAKTWLATNHLTGQVTASTTAVTVTVHRTTSTQLLGLVGVRQLHVSATATAVARRGVTTEQP